MHPRYRRLRDHEKPDRGMGDQFMDIGNGFWLLHHQRAGTQTVQEIGGDWRRPKKLKPTDLDPTTATFK
jgi:hypothetical protein